MANSNAVRRRAFAVGQLVRYKPGEGTYGYEDSLDADGRVPCTVIGFTPKRVRVELHVNLGGFERRKVAQVNRESLVPA